ncbi:fatty acyl-CoA reductase wat-like [Copidosoma floridanum]|uniref:fatty acyl-CoA reductase wat-like n=1 Tax=Copidosoma floridanum TaxID=29053 RepID=UPI000C6F9095|nr:fatty acyl-CoA reductase wat-like [Copidosoma floridanum]
MLLREWYGEREILITGVTSQLGRNLLEKLLRSFPGVKLHLIVRTRDGVEKDDRVQKSIWSSPGFARLRQERPDAASCIKIYEGNLVHTHLGLQYYEQKALANVSIVFHVGGDPACLLEFCEQLPNLRAVVVVDELLRCKEDQIIENHMGHDNFPTDLRLGIVRLPPVAPALREPMPGYVELLKAPTAVMVGAGYVLGRSDFPVEIVPIDVATNTLIVAAWDIGQRLVPLYYNASTIECTWEDIVHKGKRGCNKYRYPSFGLQGITSSIILHWLIVTVFEWLPCLIIDVIFWLFNRRKTMLQEHNRVRGLLKDFESVTYRTVQVERHRINELALKHLSPEELEMGPLYPEPMDLETYILCAAAATRKYLVGEKNLTIMQCFMPTVLLLAFISCYFAFYHCQSK